MPSSSDGRVLVLGAGSIGRRHARNLVALGARVSVADLDPTRAAEVDGCEPVPLDLDTLDRYRGVVVATPTALHRDHADAALAAGAAVLVEKPLAPSTDGLDALVAAAGDRLTVGYNLRLHRPVERVRELLCAGAAGRPALVRLWFGSHLPDWRPDVDYRTTYSAQAALGGGVLHDASHEIDLLLHLFGTEWTVAGAVLVRRSRLDIDVEDVVSAVLSSPDGLPATISLDYVSRRYRRGLEVVGDQATLRLDWATGTIEIDDARGTTVEDASTPVDESYRREAAAFLALVHGRAKPVVTAAEGAAVVRLCGRIREAARWPLP